MYINARVRLMTWQCIGCIASIRRWCDCMLIVPSVCDHKKLSGMAVVIYLSRGGGGHEHIRRSALHLHIMMHQLIIIILTCHLAVHVHWVFATVVLSNRMMMRPPGGPRCCSRSLAVQRCHCRVAGAARDPPGPSASAHHILVQWLLFQSANFHFRCLVPSSLIVTFCSVILSVQLTMLIAAV